MPALFAERAKLGPWRLVAKGGDRRGTRARGTASIVRMRACEHRGAGQDTHRGAFGGRRAGRSSSSAEHRSERFRRCWAWTRYERRPSGGVVLALDDPLPQGIRAELIAVGPARSPGFHEALSERAASQDFQNQRPALDAPLLLLGRRETTSPVARRHPWGFVRGTQGGRSHWRATNLLLRNDRHNE